MESTNIIYVGSGYLNSGLQGVRCYSVNALTYFASPYSCIFGPSFNSPRLFFASLFSSLMPFVLSALLCFIDSFMCSSQAGEANISLGHCMSFTRTL